MNFLNSFLTLNEMEGIHQIERMHAYPPKFYRLANILEKRPESVFIYKTENSFFNIIDTSKFSQNSSNLGIFLLMITILFIVKILHDQKKS
jgi:hypothetical protein